MSNRKKQLLFIYVLFSWAHHATIDSYYLGWLCVGIGSLNLSYFVIAFVSHWWVRTRYPGWFAKYNYILAAALDGGTQVRFLFHVWQIPGFFLLTKSYLYWGCVCGRSWFSCFRLLFKERLVNLTCSRSGENFLPFPGSPNSLVIHTHMDWYLLGGAPIKEVGQNRNIHFLFFCLIYLFKQKIPGNYDRCVVIP